MDRYVVIGNPIEHSQSPVIHRLFAEQTGEAVDYQRQWCALDGFESLLESLRAHGLKGCNVTVPFKFEAAAWAQRQAPGRVHERVRLAGASNTLGFDAEGVWADNTDGVGLRRDIEVNHGVALAGRRVLLIGAGGAAAGVLGPLLEARPAEMVVVNRSADKAAALVASHAVVALRGGVFLSQRALESPGTGYDLVINSTATSLSGQGVPVPASTLREDGWAWDLMYGAGAVGFLDWAAQHGAHGRDGLGMLVEQAAEAFFLWRGVRPQTAPVLAHLRAELAAKAAASQA